VGDICGSFVTKDQVYQFPDDSAIARVNNRVLGPIPADFQECAKRAKDASLFSVESKFQEDLDNCSISEDMRGEFKKNRIELSQNVVVSVEEEGHVWLITDKARNSIYAVISQEEHKNGLEIRRKANPGVIIVANGSRKAETVASAIVNGCVTELICDSNLAKELDRIIPV
jgi:hypothetical protein